MERNGGSRLLQMQILCKYASCGKEGVGRMNDLKRIKSLG
ncbi:hypothetical protein KGM_214727 [Danaus plexippus plexippus]|uniref:Uncharacterized protein n=1 Tax=Danaus plexippus plexippus TaxID=278856 RepID=A0A212EKX1_DANPL|nr:hypothetical protein KGM_214727 [Danaus plexippus plexippus]